MHKITNLWKSITKYLSKKLSLFSLKKIRYFSTLEGAVSHNLFYHQQLSVSRCQVSLFANNYVE